MTPNRDPHRPSGLDGLLAADGRIVEILHRDWTSQVRLEPSTRRVHLSLNESGGHFLKLGDDLEIVWDRAGLERFRLLDGRLVELDLLSMTPDLAKTHPLAKSKPAQTTVSRRVAIVTGYYKEPKALLQRCLASVRGQTVKVDHIVVSDGFPQDWLEAEPVRHIRLDRSHGDYGNTPRGIGALLAIAENYDVIAFLDADNWFELDHIERAIEVAESHDMKCDVVFAQRNMMRPDETIIPVADEPVGSHVDTNCFIFFRGSFHVIPTFSVIPQELSVIGDRIFYANLSKEKLRTAMIATKTVNYHCLWASIYVDAGEKPPADAKPNIDQRPLKVWLDALPPERRLEVSRRTGLQLD